jgi:hypothetical protein
MCRKHLYYQHNPSKIRIIEIHQQNDVICFEFELDTVYFDTVYFDTVYFDTVYFDTVYFDTVYFDAC